MSHKNTKNCTSIILAVSLIALTLVITSGFNHSYTALAVSDKKGSSSGSGAKSSLGGGFAIGGTSSSSSATTASPNALTKKELSSFVACINTANKSTEGLTHKVVTNCLDTAKGITPAATAASSSTTTSGGSSPSPSRSSSTT
ncbi:MAG TPA: hypothetical protein VJ729_11215 [Nitrososphaeraceae archaeon]|nr:hypothetical protein [Nitrososphaeraceae archaeon]